MPIGFRSNERPIILNSAEHSRSCPICGGAGEFVSLDLETDAFPDERPVYQPGTKIFVAHKCFNCDSEAGEIKRFEETTGESDNGLLEGLVNALLLPDDTKKEGADNDKKTPYR